MTKTFLVLCVQKKFFRAVNILTVITNIIYQNIRKFDVNIAKINNIFKNYCPNDKYVVLFYMSSILMETASEKMLSHSVIYNGGDSVNIGIIGAGRVGTSIGKYLSQYSCHTIVGFYSEHYQDAVESAVFCHTKSFYILSQLVLSSDTLFIAVTDGQIKNVWDCIDKPSARNKIISHFSGSLSSDVFTFANDYSIYTGSIHPIYAFSDKFCSYKELPKALFTVEGSDCFISRMQELFTPLGNRIFTIDKTQKPLYHAAMSMASNHLIGLLQTVTDMLSACNFDEESAYTLLKPLMTDNLNTALQKGTAYALTGPIERGDIATVEAHLNILDDTQKRVYQALGRQVIRTAKRKHADNPSLQEKYRLMERILTP